MMTTLPTPTDIRTLSSDDKQQQRRAIAYRTHPSQPTHIAILEPFAVICPQHRGHADPVVVECTGAGGDTRGALLQIADQLFERGTDPAWVCDECAGQIRWWLGAAS